MLYYIYIGFLSAYKIYEYWKAIRFAYNYTYPVIITVYTWVKPQKRITEDFDIYEWGEWDMCDMLLDDCKIRSK